VLTWLITVCEIFLLIFNTRTTSLLFWLIIIGAEEVPELQDPGLDNEAIKTSMSKDEFDVFMDAVNENLEQAILARDASNELTSTELWREIFDEKFSLYDAEESEETRSESKSLVLDDYSHAKKPRWPIQLKKRCKVRINGYIYSDKKKKLGGINSNGRVIKSGLRIKYVAKTRMRGAYEVYWQVVNTGKHAKKESGLRGEFFKAKLPDGAESSNPLVNWEFSSYTGKHWIECFIVKDGICVGRSGRFYVNIKNPTF